MRISHSSGRRLWLFAGATAVGLAMPAMALEEKKDEKEKLKACEARLCSVVTRKVPLSGDLTCALSKTWAKDKIKEGSAPSSVQWVFGDARCTLDLKIPNADIVAAMKNPEHTLQLPKHAVQCEVEREGEVTPIKLTLEPKVTFKAGKADKVWINMKEVEGPTAVKALATAAAALEDSVGLFQGPLIKAINKLLGEQCPKIAAGG
jgi:hypothetical protein